jgi:hypothetical protein
MRQTASITLPLGQLVATTAAVNTVDQMELFRMVSRHAVGDWGDVEAEDWRANDWAFRNGGRILSTYRDTRGTKVWIITEADHSVTTVLLPDEY